MRVGVEKRFPNFLDQLTRTPILSQTPDLKHCLLLIKPCSVNKYFRNAPAADSAISFADPQWAQ